MMGEEDGNYERSHGVMHGDGLVAGGALSGRLSLQVESSSEEEALWERIARRQLD